MTKYYIKMESETLEKAIFAHNEHPYSSVDEAKKDATFGAMGKIKVGDKFTIVDEKGRIYAEGVVES